MMKNFGLVSIITPTFNCGRFIEETIKSVQSQTYPYWEMIIIDDCSSDNTKEIVEEYRKNDSRIQYHCLEKNSGAAVARNTALRLAKGKWMAFLDSDDLWEPVKLEHQLKFMMDNNYHFSCTERDEIDEESKPIGYYSSGPFHVGKLGMYCYCWPGCLTVMYDKDVVGLVQINDIKKNNDYAIWLKVIQFSDCYLLKENLAHYRVRGGSISHTSYTKLIKWHYKLFRDAEEMSRIKSFVCTCGNLLFGAIKKLIYVRKVPIIS